MKALSIADQLKKYGIDATAAEKVEQKVQNAGNRRYFKTADGPQEFVGVVTDVFTKPGYKGQGTDQGVAFDVDGEEIVVAQSAKAWESSVLSASPKVGDVAVFHYGGKKMNKAGTNEYHDFSLTIAKRANAGDDFNPSTDTPF